MEKQFIGFTTNCNTWIWSMIMPHLRCLVKPLNNNYHNHAPMVHSHIPQKSIETESTGTSQKHRRCGIMVIE